MAGPMRLKVKLDGPDRLAKALEVIEGRGTLLLVNRRRNTLAVEELEDAALEDLRNLNARVTEDDQYDID